MGLPPGVAVASLGVPSFQQPLGEEQAPPAAAGLAVVAAGLELLEVGEGLAGEGELLLGELLGLGELEGLGLELELELELEVVPALARPARAPKLPPPPSEPTSPETALIACCMMAPTSCDAAGGAVAQSSRGSRRSASRACCMVITKLLIERGTPRYAGTRRPEDRCPSHRQILRGTALMLCYVYHRSAAWI